MKKSTLFTLVMILLGMVAFAQTVPNGDFELWDAGLSYDNPTDWETPNAAISLFSSDWICTKESTVVHGGSYAAKIESKQIVTILGTYDIPGFLTLGDLSVNTSSSTADVNGGVPFTDRPDELQGFYQFVPNGTDVFMVEVVLLNYDDVNEVILDTIGAGYYTTGVATTGWVQFIAPITYNTAATPNYMNINVLSTDPGSISIGSVAYVDDFTFFTDPTPTPELFFSEYIEGSSNNKALEIYNGTGAAVNLADYIIAQAANAGGWQYYHNFPAGATLADNDVWVIITDQVDGTLFSASNADEVLSFPSVVHHNGNDARALMKLVGTDSIIVDQFGDPNIDPGQGWDAAGVSIATKNHTMVRKPTVVAGTIDWVTGFGTDAANSEWIVNPENDFTNLGMHNSTGNIPAITVTNPLDGSTVYLTDVTVEFTVANFAVGTTSAGLDGHVHYSFDGGSTVMIYDTNPIPFTGLALGSHTMKMWLVDNAHQPLSPAVEDSIGFTIALNNQALITSFVVPNMIGNEIIDNMNFTVLAVVPPSTNLTSIIPTIGVSTAATINPASGVAQDFTNVVSYTVTAQDGTTQLWSVSVIQPSLLTISAIQGQSAASPYAGQTVITGGIVTGVFSGLNGYFVQDGAGAWNGVFVYDSQNTPAVGDDVSFMAEVEEYYELTELKNISGFVVNSSGNALPAVTLLSTNDVNNEDYEGVLVRVEAAECIDLPNSYDEWTVNDGSGACMVDNDNFAYAPTIGSFYNIQGPLNFTFGDFKIQIRESADISVYASTNMISNNNVSVYPNPVNDVLNISNLESNSTVAIFNVLGTMISTHSANNSLSIDMSSLSSGVYFVRVENSETITSTRIVKR